MKKNIWMSVKAAQQFQGCQPEQIEFMTDAVLYERNGTYFITYEESDLTGLEGTRTTVKLAGKNITVIRTGSYPMRMLFVEHERYTGMYPVSAGIEIEMAMYTTRISNTIHESGGQLAIDYTIEMDNVFMGKNHFELKIVPARLNDTTVFQQNKVSHIS